MKVSFFVNFLQQSNMKVSEPPAPFLELFKVLTFFYK